MATEQGRSVGKGWGWGQFPKLNIFIGKLEIKKRIKSATFGTSFMTLQSG